jgi:uncharacterized spore protein YtfJ
MVDDSEAMDEARQAAEHGGPTDRLVRLVLGRLGGRIGVKALFGDPVERGDVTVIPVGRLRWFFGAGSGSGPGSQEDADATGEGSGAGGGAIGDPVGYLEIGPSGVRFRRIVEFPPNPLMVLAVGVSAALILRNAARLVGR